ncbi:MAG: DNA polymerase I [Planctomycetia bacterium]|nr:DNA polymerase I [Planctomycetia bacterium]
MTTPNLTDKTVCVLDAHGILYQVFHTMGEMSSPQGEATGAVYGFVRDLTTVFTKVPFDYIFCAFDLPGKTFRHDLYSLYKANRESMPLDLQAQLDYVRQFLPALGITPLGLAGYEADDLLATVAAQTTQAGGNCVLVTSDKDARQLLTEKVSLYQLRKERYYTDKELLDDWGITPEQVLDYQTMVGDATDNIPGIPLVGPKTASALLKQYGSLDGVYAHLAELTGKKRDNIAASRDQAGISRQLVTLKRDVPIDIPWTEGLFRGVDPVRLRELCEYFGFRSLFAKFDAIAKQFGEIHLEPDPARKYAGTTRRQSSASVEKSDSYGELPLFAAQGGEMSESESPSGPPLAESIQRLLNRESDRHRLLLDLSQRYPRAVERWPNMAYHCVDSNEALDRFCALLAKQKLVSIDLETTDKRPRFAKVVGLAFCFENDRAWYIPVQGPLGSPMPDPSYTWACLTPFLESQDLLKIGQNIKYDTIVLRARGVSLNGVVFDTMVADYLLRAGEQSHNLDSMAENYLQHETIPIEKLIGTGRQQKNMRDISVEQVSEYAGEDAAVPWLLFPWLLAELKRDPNLLRLFAELEMPLIDVLVEMEFEGIAIDSAFFKEVVTRFTDRLAALDESIRSEVALVDADPNFAAGFNLQSPQQLQRVLFDDLKLPVLKKTKTGRSTDIEVLEGLARIHKLPEKIIEHRQLSKLLGTYASPLPLMVNPDTHRIHASFNQVVTATGRLSSSDPNLQNIPVRSEEGKLIRTGFVPDAANNFTRLLSFDYSQVELRVLTHFSGDANLIKAFENDEDIHTHVASNLFHVPSDEVTAEMRRKAKAVNFGLVYGQSAFGLARTIDISREEAAVYIDSFFRTYESIKVFFEKVLADCHRLGYVQTLFGRKRRIEGVRAVRSNQQLTMPERTAINTVIQGTAADLMKLAMVRVWQRLYHKEKVAPSQARLLLQIHDELVFETVADLAPVLSSWVVEEMELGQPLIVPLKVDCESGANWGAFA